jgi:hypothetical protein
MHYLWLTVFEIIRKAMAIVVCCVALEAVCLRQQPPSQASWRGQQATTFSGLFALFEIPTP